MTSRCPTCGTPVRVVSDEVDRLTRDNEAIREEEFRLSRRLTAITSKLSTEEAEVDRLTRELEEVLGTLSAASDRVEQVLMERNELCSLAGHPLVGGACRCGERGA